MSTSTHIIALVPDADAEYIKHKGVLLACRNAGVSLPRETTAYFGDSNPDPRLLIDKLSVELEEGVHYAPYESDYEQGFEVDLAKLPKGAVKLRFYNSW